MLPADEAGASAAPRFISGYVPRVALTDSTTSIPIDRWAYWRPAGLAASFVVRILCARRLWNLCGAQRTPRRQSSCCCRIKCSAEWSDASDYTGCNGGDDVNDSIAYGVCSAAFRRQAWKQWCVILSHTRSQRLRSQCSIQRASRVSRALRVHRTSMCARKGHRCRWRRRCTNVRQQRMHVLIARLRVYMRCK